MDSAGASPSPSSVGELRLFRTAWRDAADCPTWPAFFQTVLDAGWAGVEAPAPESPAESDAFFAALEASKLAWIAEVSTCTAPGLFVPIPGRSWRQHLASLEEGVRRSLQGRDAGCAPEFVNTMAGADYFSASDALSFHASVLELEAKLGLPISVETHRGRYTYSPWLTRDLLLALPTLRITADVSHWVNVSERLVLDDEPELLSLLSDHVYHVQPRVGYSCGPQVPDPRAPEWADELKAHERWWDVMFDAVEARGQRRPTATPEFGPGHYLQATPFTRTPAADLWEVNRWIGERQRARRARLAGGGGRGGAGTPRAEGGTRRAAMSARCCRCC